MRITHNVCIVIASSIVLYKPILPKTFDTINPADIRPKEKQETIKPIAPSEKSLYFATITIIVKKYPSPRPVKKAAIDKYFTLVLMLLKST